MNHQYSEREALPEKVAYFCFRTVLTDSVNPISMPPIMLAASAVATHYSPCCNGYFD
ncbi:hypothetical protein RHECNPAF_203002 [Rhizobium etli CNPAF512]|nr:hypothetical protein RHECNPAF_203002 [Rhizobium etli CNPAF512]